MTQLLTYPDIDPQQWQALIDRSPYATWFQTKEAYEFYAANPDEMTPFIVGIEEDGYLTGVIVGYTTQEKNPIKQLLTCRSIISGGPLLAEDISETALAELLKAVKKTAYRQSPIANRPIYIESRNFHDYSKWRNIFEASGFAYQSHLNFHVDTSSSEIVDQNLGKSRKRDIRTTIRDGVTPVYQPTIEQVRAYYDILLDLYKTKVKTPLFKWEWFEQLYKVNSARFILTELEGKIVGGTVCMVLPGKALYEWFACGIDGVYPHILSARINSVFPVFSVTYIF